VADAPPASSTARSGLPSAPPPAGRAGGAPRLSQWPRLRSRITWRGWSYVFVLPAVVALAATFGYPLVEVARFSFYAGTIQQPVYVGTGNYLELWHDPVFIRSVLDNLKLLTAVPVMTVLAIGIALAINAGYRRMKVYQAIVFLPYVLPATAIGLTFSYLLSQSGIVNTVLHQWHLGGLAKDWLGSAHWAIPTIGAVIIWQQLGFGVVVLTAALLAVPQELIEAARIDGASGWRIQWYVLIPHIRRIIGLFVMIEAITMLSAVFTYVFVLTQAGPAYSSSVMEYYIYQNGFQQGAVGLASAAAVVLLAVASVFIIIYLRLRSRGERVAL
jgi:ABC-type sugar transport system permease subunit